MRALLSAFLILSLPLSALAQELTPAQLTATELSPPMATELSEPALAPVLEKDPESIPALKHLLDKGATLLELPPRFGMKTWFVKLEGGATGVAYQTPDDQGVIFGQLYDGKGDNITAEQIEAEAAQIAAIVQTPAAPAAQTQTQAQSQTQAKAPSSKAEALWQNMAQSGGLMIGDLNAPAIQVMVDPQCPHCKNLWKMLKPAVDSGKISVHLLPVEALAVGNAAYGAAILSAPNPNQAWEDHVNGIDTPLPPAPNAAMLEIIRKNTDIMFDNNIKQVPFTMWRSKAGNLKVLFGEPSDIAQIIDDAQ